MSTNKDERPVCGQKVGRADSPAKEVLRRTRKSPIALDVQSVPCSGFDISQRYRKVIEKITAYDCIIVSREVYEIDRCRDAVTDRYGRAELSFESDV